VQARIGGVVEVEQVAQVGVAVGQRRQYGIFDIRKAGGQQTAGVELA
jgi:hypothetical protein